MYGYKEQRTMALTGDKPVTSLCSDGAAGGRRGGGGMRGRRERRRGMQRRAHSRR